MHGYDIETVAEILGKLYAKHKAGATQKWISANPENAHPVAGKVRPGLPMEESR